MYWRVGVALVWYAPWTLTSSLSSLASFFHQLLTINHSASIWVAFGAGKAFSYFHSTPSSVKAIQALPAKQLSSACVPQVFWQGEEVGLGNLEALS